MIAKEVNYAVERPEAGAGSGRNAWGKTVSSVLCGFVRFLKVQIFRKNGKKCGFVGFRRFLLGRGKANGEAALAIGIFYGIRRLPPPSAAWRWGAADSESGFVSKGGRKLPNGCKIGAETGKSSAFARLFCGRDAFANPTLDRRRTEPARMVHLATSARVSSHWLASARVPPPPAAGVQGRRVQDSKLGIGAELFLRARAGGASWTVPHCVCFSLSARARTEWGESRREGRLLRRPTCGCLRFAPPLPSPLPHFMAERGFRRGNFWGQCPDAPGGGECIIAALRIEEGMAIYWQ